MLTLQVQAYRVGLFGVDLLHDQIAVHGATYFRAWIQCEVGRVRAHQWINLA